MQSFCAEAGGGNRKCGMETDFHSSWAHSGIVINLMRLSTTKITSIAQSLGKPLCTTEITEAFELRRVSEYDRQRRTKIVVILTVQSFNSLPEIIIPWNGYFFVNHSEILQRKCISITLSTSFLVNIVVLISTRVLHQLIRNCSRLTFCIPSDLKIDMQSFHLLRYYMVIVRHIYSWRKKERKKVTVQNKII